MFHRQWQQNLKECILRLLIKFINNFILILIFIIKFLCISTAYKMSETEASKIILKLKGKKVKIIWLKLDCKLLWHGQIETKEKHFLRLFLNN